VDNASQQTGDLTFTGAFNGTLGSQSKLTNAFTGPTSQSIMLGGNDYTADIGLFVPPQPGSPGQIGANVTVLPGPPPAAARDVPEPTTFLLASLGLSTLGMRTCCRRRRVAR
jgi:hypothetical protein